SSIVKIAGNSVLDAMYAGLLTQTQRARYMAIQLHDHWDLGVREHEEILELLAKKDGPALGELLKRHVKQTGQRVVESLKLTETAAE
ncbi:MAG: FCD domain-containing protein, partial [Rhodospirillales bacterium]|nr:FCD domain-containing protein [Rhodospirillales bacterium]